MRARWQRTSRGPRQGRSSGLSNGSAVSASAVGRQRWNPYGNQGSVSGPVSRRLCQETQWRTKEQKRQIGGLVALLIMTYTRFLNHPDLFHSELLRSLLAAAFPKHPSGCQQSIFPRQRGQTANPHDRGVSLPVWEPSVSCVLQQGI